MEIKTKQAYDEAMEELESLLKRGLSNLNDVEELRLQELSVAVETWENITYSIN